VHGAGHRDRGGGLQDTHRDLLVCSGTLAGVEGGYQVVGRYPAVLDQPRAITPPGVRKAEDPAVLVDDDGGGRTGLDGRRDVGYKRP
jgi:hypothetical protein